MNTNRAPAVGNASLQGFRHSIYGLTVRSDIELINVSAAAPGAEPDIEIVRCPLAHEKWSGEETMVFDNAGDSFFIAWQSVGGFRITDGRRIEMDVKEGVEDKIALLPLLGSVFAALLHQRGLYILHASAVSVDGRAIALLGDKGAGKSTTATAMIAAGHALITDDIVAIDFSDPERPTVLPASGQIKLWGDAASHFVPDAERHLWQLHESIDKANYEFSDGFTAAPVPLGRLYVLNRTDKAGTEAISDMAGLATLLRFSYMARFGETGFGTAMDAHFRRSAALVQSDRLRRLDVPGSLERINEAIDAVRKDLSTL